MRGATAGLAALLLASAAPAQERVREDHYRVDLEIDLPVLLLAGTAWALSPTFQDDLVDPSCPCDESDVSPLDRWSIGHRSDALDLVSDVALGLAIATPFAVDALADDGSRDRWRRFGEDAVVMGEAVVVSGAMTQLVKLLVDRPRPHLYQRSAGDPELEAEENYLAFPSSHVSTVFAIGLSAARTYTLHHPEGSGPAAYGTAIAAGAAMGLMRIFSGRHFTTDVVTGAGIGAAAGLGIPWLHTRTRAIHLGAGESRGKAVLQLSLEVRQP